jgi:hypothetical protein
MNSIHGYFELEQSLRAKGIGSYFQNENLLVVSNANPAMPDSNSFWITCKAGEWYLGTWLPSVYRIPTTADVPVICEAVFNSAPKAVWELDNRLAAELGLRRLTETEIESLGFA